MNQIELDGLLCQLNKSPMFQLSLSAKELFHSNFIKWLCETNKEELGKVFSPYLPKGEDTPKTITEVSREERSIDLIIKFENDYQLFIENKVKSIPNAEQLREYGKRGNAKTGYLLLSLTKPSFELDAKNLGVEWRYLSYTDLSEKLSTLTLNDDYHRTLLGDYRNFIELLHELQLGLGIAGMGVEYTLAERMRNSLKKVRIYDLVQKMRCAQIAEMLKEKLLNVQGIKLIDPISLASDKGYKKLISNEIKHGDAWVSSDFSRGEGLLEFKCVLKEADSPPVVIGIQVQGDKFRWFVELQKGVDAKEKFSELEKSGWNFEPLKKLGSRFSEAKKTRGEDDQLKYGNHFKYKYAKVGKVTVKELIEAIANYACWANRRFD